MLLTNTPSPSLPSSLPKSLNWILESVQQHEQSLVSHQDRKGWYGLPQGCFYPHPRWSQEEFELIMEIIMFTTTYVLEDITKYMWYEISWQENMNGRFPWYCIGHKICLHQWLVNINLSFFFLDLHCCSGQCIAIHLCQCTDMYRAS